ncbi:MAG: protein kinase [Coriobacteriia bacterium]|nr:protein kinase [Coriobacteriia bacterium]
MISEIIGNTYKYVIDTSYGINKDGFIAIGSESVVYKGLKVKREGGMQFSCVLKFKPKVIVLNGKTIDRLMVFKTEEWKIFEELRECRSIVRVDDVVDDLGSFKLPCDKVIGGEINGASYFCVIEEFIDGWSLEEFCREEYWKLRRIETLANGLSKVNNYHDFNEEEKTAIALSYNYDNVLKYQGLILLFMINLCEIMEFVTEQKQILHLDIKPENIMVTRHGKELVLIDFGKSKSITQANRFIQSNLEAADYNKDETLDSLYQHGTLGYAAPECYSKSAHNSAFPFSATFVQGRMSIESDFFSLGATFWECLNIFELATKSKLFTDDFYSFYKENFLNDNAYCNRDLSCTSLFYHRKLENIVKKCTRKRVDGFTDFNNKDYYHSYKDLKKDLEIAKDSVPTIVREENVKVKNAFKLSGAMLSLFSVFLIIYYIYLSSAFSIAGGSWNSLTSDYNETRFYKLEEIAHDLITTAPANKLDETYAMIAGFTYEDGDISEYEAIMLVSLLVQIGNQQMLPQRIDEIVINANTRKFREISTEIIKLDPSKESIGYDLARAIYNVEVGKTEIIAAYEVLVQYQDNVEFLNALVKLKNVLDNDENISIVSKGLGLSKQEVQEFFRTIAV